MVLPNWYPGELLNAVSKSVMAATFLTHPTHCEVYWFCTVVIRMFRVRKLSERAPCRVTYNKDSLRLSFSFFSSFHAAFLSFFSQISSYIRTCESLKGNTHNFSLETKNEGNVTSGPCTLSLSLVFVHQLQCMELRNGPWFKLFVVVTHLLGADTVVLLPFSASVFAPKEKMCFAMNWILLSHPACNLLSLPYLQAFVCSFCLPLRKLKGMQVALPRQDLSEHLSSHLINHFLLPLTKSHRDKTCLGLHIWLMFTAWNCPSYLSLIFILMNAHCFAQRWKQGVRNPQISRSLDPLNISSTMTAPFFIGETCVNEYNSKIPTF